MSAANESRIVVKKVINVAAGHHGGGWKIAYRKILLPQNVLASKNVSNFF